MSAPMTLADLDRVADEVLARAGAQANSVTVQVSTSRKGPEGGGAGGKRLVYNVNVVANVRGALGSRTERLAAGSGAELEAAILGAHEELRRWRPARRS